MAEPDNAPKAVESRMAAIKAALDPQDIMNPGKVIDARHVASGRTRP